MATRTGRHVAQRAKAKAAGRKAENSPPMRFLARTGFFARGLMYVVIGWIAVEIAFGKTSQQADRSGALQTLGRTPAGEIAERPETLQDFVRQPRQFHQAEGLGRELSERAFRHTID